MAFRQGMRIIRILKLEEPNTMLIVKWIIENKTLYQPDMIYADTVGIGAGVVHRLNEMRHFVCPINGGENAQDEEKYANIRAELCDRLRSALESGLLGIPNDPELIDELASIREVEGGDRKGRLLMMSKREMRAKGIPSPNKADAIIYTFRDPEDIFITNEKRDIYRESFKREDVSFTEHGWMAA